MNYIIKVNNLKKIYNSIKQILKKKDLAIYVLNQKGRLYFSNQDKLDYVNHNYILVKKIKINGITVTKIFLNKT